MTEENYRENNPNKYRLSDRTIITESNYNTLLQAFTSTYNSMTDENTGYVTDAEKRNLNALLHSFEVIGSMNLAMEFDKESRFLAYTHWNSQENKFDVNHRNAPEKWFKKSPQQLAQEQEKEEIQTTQAAIAVGTSYEEWEEMLNDNEIAEKRIEQIQVNSGMSEAAIEADILASENQKADWIDSDGNPHWNDEEEIDEPIDMAGYEYDEYIHSEEFIEKFGDWEKANRIEELKKSETIVKDGSIIIDNNDYSSQIDKYEKEHNLSQLRLIGGILGDEIKGTYNNINVNTNSIKEIKRHDIENPDHLKSIYFIPDFLNKGTFISQEPNEDIVTNRKVIEYQYLISGLKINNTVYTVKSAIALDDNGNRYYDHKLSEIEKGDLLASLSSVTRQGKYSNLLYDFNDMRLLQVCQVSQMAYLEQNPVTHKWQPTEEAVNLVKEGKLYQEKDPVTGFYSMCDETKVWKTALDFRNAYNATKKNYEPKITYENSRDFAECTRFTDNNLSFLNIHIINNEVIIKTSKEFMSPLEYMSPREYFDKSLQNINFETLEAELNAKSEPNDLQKKVLEELTSIKNINDLNQYAKECKDIVYNSCKVCTVLNEKIDFDHVINHSKDFFNKEFENLKNKPDSSTDKDRLKEKYEYFKKNAMELYKAANSEYSIELSKQQNQEAELANAKKTIQEQNQELDIWTSKAESDNKEISKLNAQLEAANNTIQKLEKQNKEQDELRNGKGSVKVNGVERTFDKGLKHAFPEAVKRIDIENQRNKDLTAAYNELLKSQNQNISPKSPGDDSSWSD